MFELIEIITCKEDHIKILYKILAEKTFSISHESLPPLEEHKNFVKNNPYRKWYLIKKTNHIIGSIYISNENIIGINIPNGKSNEYVHSIKLIIKKHPPLDPIKSVRSKSYCINTNPKNKNLINALGILNMEHIENTYRLKD